MSAFFVGQCWQMITVELWIKQKIVGFPRDCAVFDVLIMDFKNKTHETDES